MVGDQLRDHLGVGVAAEDDALGDQLPFQGGVVLDDAVVNHGDQAVAGQVRVGVAIVGGAVRCPARVADAHAPRGRLVAQPAHQAVMRPAPACEVQRAPLSVASPALS